MGTLILEPFDQRMTNMVAFSDHAQIPVLSITRGTRIFKLNNSCSRKAYNLILIEGPTRSFPWTLKDGYVGPTIQINQNNGDYMRSCK